MESMDTSNDHAHNAKGRHGSIMLFYFSYSQLIVPWCKYLILYFCVTRYSIILYTCISHSKSIIRLYV